MNRFSNRIKIIETKLIINNEIITTEEFNTSCFFEAGRLLIKNVDYTWDELIEQKAMISAFSVKEESKNEGTHLFVNELQEY